MSDESNLVDGRYRLIKELGAGNFGSVYRAKQVVLGKDVRDVALKLFRGQVISAENVERNMNDALAIIALLADLSDWEIRQHFVTVFDLGLTRDAPPQGYVAMELVRGGSLEGRLKHFGGKFTLLGALHYVLQLARGMAYMHSCGYVHSDLKPANLLVFDGRGHDLVKIGDFGLAGRYLGPVGAGPSGGTLSYLPPEALEGMNTTSSGDVFSMGVLAYEMITGSNPYADVGRELDGESPDYNRRMTEAQLAARRYAPLELRPRDFPEIGHARESQPPNGPPPPDMAMLLEVVNKMAASSPGQRYASARGVLSDLERIAAGKLPSLDDRGRREAGDDDPLRAAAENVETFLRTSQWDDALRTANEAIAAAPGRCDGYLWKSKAHRAQAELLQQAGRSNKMATQFLRQAQMPLQRGLQTCTAPADQKRLRLALADIHRELGDTASSDRLRQQT